METGNAALENMSWRAMRLIGRTHSRTSCIKSERGMEVRSHDNIDFPLSSSNHTMKSYIASKKIAALDSAYFQAIL